MEQQYHYSVIYAQILKQRKITDFLRKSMPDGKGVVFYPCGEYWWNGKEEYVIKPLFPGYVFIRSALEPAQLHKLVLESMGVINSYVRELGAITTDAHAIGDAEIWNDSSLIDLNENEARLFDFLLDCGNYEDVQEEAKIFADNQRTDIIRMSRGYEENGRYHVMEGPLKGYEDYIVKVNKKDKKATFDLKVGGHQARVGLEIFGKKKWFPEDEKAPEVLDNGYEVDPEKIAFNMMRGK